MDISMDEQLFTIYRHIQDQREENAIFGVFDKCNFKDWLDFHYLHFRCKSQQPQQPQQPQQCLYSVHCCDYHFHNVDNYGHKLEACLSFASWFEFWGSYLKNLYKRCVDQYDYEQSFYHFMIFCHRYSTSSENSVCNPFLFKTKEMVELF